MKRDEVTVLAPTGDLGLIDKSSFLFDSLFLFGPDREKTTKKHSHNSSISNNLKMRNMDASLNPDSLAKRLRSDHYVMKLSVLDYY